MNELLSYENWLFYLTFAFYGFASLFYFGNMVSKNATLGYFATGFSIIGLLVNAGTLGLRTYIAGRVPLTSGYEFLLAFAWGIVLVYIYAEYKYKWKVLGAFVVPIAWLLLGWVAVTMPQAIERSVQPLMPALQSEWLTYHVITAIFSYGAFAVSFGFGLMYLIRDRLVGSKGSKGMNLNFIPSLETLDELSYRMIAFAFPLLSLVIITGAIWAEYAWGRYWSWDPKETWSLITWLIYAAYLHARFTYGWRGRRAAVMAVMGFLAVLFTFFGVNYFLSGLHSYAQDL